MFADNTQDHIRCDDILSVGIDDILESLAGIGQIGIHVIESGVGDDLVEGTLQFTDVGLDICRDIFQDLVVQMPACDLRVFAEDRHPGLVIRRLDIRDQSPFETGTEAFVQCLHFTGRPVGGQNDLFSCLM